uniref:Uncharacterized protein n=1 Tax=Arundo donax TaxID=35708 RepID=A0A0A9HQQ9_ARUDO
MLPLLDTFLTRPDLSSIAKTPVSVLTKMASRPSAKPAAAGVLLGERVGSVLSSMTLRCVHAAVPSRPASLEHR